MTAQKSGVRVCPEGLDLLMPMHLVFDRAGRILRSGPTIASMAGTMVGRQLEDVLMIRRPRMAAGADQILQQAGRRLTVDLRTPVDADDPDRPEVQRLRGVAVPLPQGGGLIQFAFGPDLARAVQAHDLSASAFSPVDSAKEILFLLEAQALIRQELQALTEQLDASLRTAEAEAETDRLTGLGNRRAMDRALEHLFSHPCGNGFGLMHLDLDHFKAVNDTLGHAAGDAVLAEVADILREETRRDDVLCRMGGDEFVLVLPDCGDSDLLAGIAQRILGRLADPIPFQGSACRISGSIGIALSADHPVPDLDALLADADAALYRAKNAGRAAYAFHGRDGIHRHLGGRPEPDPDTSEDERQAGP